MDRKRLLLIKREEEWKDQLEKQVCEMRGEFKRIEHQVLNNTRDIESLTSSHKELEHSTVELRHYVMTELNRRDRKEYMTTILFSIGFLGLLYVLLMM